MSNILRLLRSKAVLGMAAVILAWLSSLPVLDWKHVIGGLGALVATAGFRDALHKIADAMQEQAVPD
jgi:hypothetical protein